MIFISRDSVNSERNHNSTCLFNVRNQLLRTKINIYLKVMLETPKRIIEKRREDMRREEKKKKIKELKYEMNFETSTSTINFDIFKILHVTI